MLFFTSDHHFNHGNAISYCNRPFDSVGKMNRAMIDNWNSVVGLDDIVFHLGDFCFGNSNDVRTKFFHLNGIINILYNPWHHDKYWMPSVFTPVLDFSSRSGYKVNLTLPVVVLEFPEYGDKYPKALVLSHYPQLFWERKHYGSWHLFGHSHGKTINNGLSMDVGVDCNNFTPVSLDEVAKRMEELENENR